MAIASRIRRHPAAAAMLAWLLFLTLAAAFSDHAAQLPIDARTGIHAQGATLDFPAWGILVEPVAALGHILAGAPDMRVAIVSTLAWIALAALAAALIMRLPLRRGVHIVAGSILLYLLYMCFVLMVPLPDWHLKTDDPKLIVADLHSHSLNSHDGLITPAQSLHIHQDRGFNVVGFTEHGNPAGAAVAAGFGGHGLPDTIPGIEVQTPDGEFLLAIGLKPGKPIPTVLHDHADTLRFIRQTHDIHHGAVIALSWRLTPAKVRQLAADGVDGFEISNAGHPSMSPALRQALLAAQREQGLDLIASSDWHGWSGFFHTWTLIKPQASEIGASRADTVINVLRSHDYRHLIPVTADAMGTPSAARAILAPFAETLRYARELSPLRLASWWAWMIILFLASRLLQQRRLDPGRFFISAAVATCATGLVVQGAAMLLNATEMDPANHFAVRIALTGIGIGLVAGLAAFRLLQDVRERRQALTPSGVQPVPVSSRELT
ncbi:MAG TPA: hypothetical protein VNH42_07785 [Mariprofundaceae bacterium]|nr:hypothetical protein [Mariprofundaceae bacterium]